MQRTLDRWEHENDLAILDKMTSKAFDCQGRRIGHLKQLTRVSVSPDAQTMACVGSDGREQFGDAGRTITVMDGSGSIHSFRLEELGSKLLAISSTGCTAIAVNQWRVDRLLLLIMGDHVSDLLPLAKGSIEGRIESLSFSGNGSLLAVGSRDSFVVLDVKRRSVNFEARGRFPTLSPTGRGLSFVNGRQLVYRDLITSGIHLPYGRRWVSGIGGWSPDSRYLLVGMSTGIMQNQVRILDVAAGMTVDVVAIGEGNFGTAFTWVSRKLIERD